MAVKKKKSRFGQLRGVYKDFIKERDDAWD